MGIHHELISGRLCREMMRGYSMPLTFTGRSLTCTILIS